MNLNDVDKHPGLLLDKHHKLWPADPREDREFARKELERVTKTKGDQALLDGALKRYRNALEARGAKVWGRKLSTPLALHLARAGAFENAGLCLHPVYGFAYLPGTGLKGMARAYAEVVAGAGNEEIEAVFGRMPAKNEQEAEAGAVVFHEAWPVKWPKLKADIVNNHHSKYYQGTADSDPPEDWEDPIPVNFLTAAAGAEFRFAVSFRRPQADGGRLLERAQEWLNGALGLLGAGAKTNAGYGRFAPATPVAASESLAAFSCKLKLVSPAFLAGPLQTEEDCELRGATLRGLLRSWWRTLHAGYLRVGELRKLEGELWGTTERGGAIALHVEPVATQKPQRFDREQIRRANRLPEPPNRRTTPGLFYASYGMEGNPGRGKPPRWYMPPGAEWKLVVTARKTGGTKAAQVLDQAVVALWMLATFGGVGAKSRRGFGSLAISEQSMALPEGALDARNRAAAARTTEAYNEHFVKSPSLHQMDFDELDLSRSNPWQALDRLGAAYQAFASSEKHKREKMMLGLPRSIHARPGERLRHPAGNYQRHASPLLFRLTQAENVYAARVSAWYSPHLPNLEGSAAYLERCIEHMRQFLEGRHG